MIRSLKL